MLCNNESLINGLVFSSFMLEQSKDRKKVSGGMRKFHRKKRLAQKAGIPTLTKIGKHSVRIDAARGGTVKARVIRAEYANIYDPTAKQFKKAKIQTVFNNPANRHYTRANIMGKGSIITTEIGKARVTSRPGQDGVVNATLIEAAAAK